MRSKSWLYFVLFICLAQTMSDALAGTTQKLRPLTVKVIDSHSKQALEGIAIHYIVVKGTFRTSTLWVLPPIEPLVGYTIVSKRSAKTNVYGEVTFEGVEVYLESYFIWPRVERIDTETIFINLEPTESAKIYSDGGEKIDLYDLLYRQLPELKYVTHPNQEYLGYVLTTVGFIDKAHGREQEAATFEFRPEDFSVSQKDKAYFTVELRNKKK